MRTKCPTKLLADLPSSEDAFGGHARVADAIATLIKQKEGGKSIALIGSWGSGKSTVINLLEKELGDYRNTKIFVFDAWAHEGDPLRRSFLEKLIDDLSGIGWIPKRKGEKTKKILAKRIKITTTTKAPRLTLGGIFFAIAALLVPIGLALVRDQDLPRSVPIWLGYALVGSPLLVIVFILTISLIKSIGRVLWATMGWLRSKPPDSKRVQSFTDSIKKSDWSKDWRNVLSLLISKSEVDETNEAIETPDPTSVEFKEHFQGILEEALDSFKEKRLLIVIDNLDRANVNTAMSIWATMRTFFEYSEFNPRPKWMERLWLLVPFAPQAPQRLWKETVAYEEAKEDQTREGENNKNKKSKKSAKEKSLAEEFVDKTFQIIFHVPLPVMSDWKEFFKEQLNEALPNHEKDFYPIYRIFEQKRVHTNRPPTPREIKLFINKLGAYHRIWQDEIPLSIQAWYVLDVSEKLKTESPETVLLNKGLLSDDLRGVIKEPEWQKYLAALYFNVDIDKAMQILIGDEIKDYLCSGNGKDLKKLQGQVEPQSFITVLEHVIANNSLDWEGHEPPALAKAAVALKSLEQIDSPEWQRIEDHLRDSAGKAEWTVLDKEVGEGLVAILEDCSKGQYEQTAQAILKNIRNPESPAEDEETPEVPDPAIVKAWGEGLLYVLRAIHESGREGLIQEHFRMPGDEVFYVEVMRALAQLKAEKSLIKYFVPPIDSDQVVARLATLCEQEQFDASYAYGFQLMLKLDISWSWEELVTALNERLQSSNNLRPSEIAGCVGILVLLSYKTSVPEATEYLKVLSTHGHLAHHLYEAQTADDIEAVSFCLLPIFDEIPSGNLQKQIGNSQAGINYYSEILDSPEDYDDIIDYLTQLILQFMEAERLIQKAETEPETEDLVSSVLERIIKGQRGYEYVTPDLLVKAYDSISSMLSEETFIDLVNQLVEKANLLAEIRKGEFDPDLSELYLLLFKVTEDQQNSHYQEFLLKGIASVREERWSQELDKEGGLLELTLYLVESGISLNLAVDFHDALRGYVLRVTDGEVSPSAIIEEKWGTLLDAFEDSWKDSFLKSLWDYLMQRADKGVELGLQLYGDDLFQVEVSQDKAEDIIRGLFSEILKRKNIEELIWLSRALQKGSVWKKCSNGPKRLFRERVEKEIREEDDPKIREQLDPIARAIGIDVNKIERESEKLAACKEESEEEEE